MSKHPPFEVHLVVRAPHAEIARGVMKRLEMQWSYLLEFGGDAQFFGIHAFVHTLPEAISLLTRANRWLAVEGVKVYRERINQIILEARYE